VNVLAAVLTIAALSAMAAALAWVWVPLFRGPRLAAAPHLPARRLLLRREAILSTVRDLDADHLAGRVSDSDYAALRSTAMAEGAATLADIDRLGSGRAQRRQRLCEVVEADVSRRVGQMHPGSHNADSSGRGGPGLGDGDRGVAGIRDDERDRGDAWARSEAGDQSDAGEPSAAGEAEAAAPAPSATRDIRASRDIRATRDVRASRDIMEGGRRCPDCGRSCSPGDAFCARCGRRLDADGPEAA
jgi:hypothetical protein